LDITDKEALLAYVKRFQIDTIINCAAYTNVKAAETDYEGAYAVNVKGIENLCATDCKIIHISTDYVFDGEKGDFYTEEDETNPLNVYGKTKLEGEQQLLDNAKGNAIIIRTAWLYSIYGNNFVKIMQRLGKERAELNVVADQVGTPTLANDLASSIVTIINKLQVKLNQEQDNITFIKEVYHFSNEGVCSWYDFAKAIMRLSNLPCKVNPISSESYPTKVRRPYYSVLDKSKIKNDFGVDVPYWLDSLEKIIK
jgi:dTDP-4-dehydrorhamnose reductase